MGIIINWVSRSRRYPEGVELKEIHHCSQPQSKVAQWTNHRNVVQPTKAVRGRSGSSPLVECCMLNQKRRVGGLSKNGKEDCMTNGMNPRITINENQNQTSNLRNPNLIYKMKSIYQLHPWWRSCSKDDPEFPRIHGSQRHCVMQVRRQARSRDDHEIPRRSHFSILSLLPNPRFKIWRQFINFLSLLYVLLQVCSSSDCVACRMMLVTATQNKMKWNTSSTRRSCLLSTTDPVSVLIRSSRFIQMENWAMAGSVRRRI